MSERIQNNKLNEQIKEVYKELITPKQKREEGTGTKDSVYFETLTIPKNSHKRVIILHNLQYEDAYYTDIIHSLLYNQKKPAHCRRVIGETCPICELRYKNQNIFWEHMKSFETKKLIRHFNAIKVIKLFVYDLDDGKIKRFNIYGYFSGKDTPTNDEIFLDYYKQFSNPEVLIDKNNEGKKESISANVTIITNNNYKFSFEKGETRITDLSNNEKTYIKKYLKSLKHLEDFEESTLSYDEMKFELMEYLKENVPSLYQEISNEEIADVDDTQENEEEEYINNETAEDVPLETFNSTFEEGKGIEDFEEEDDDFI